MTEGDAARGAPESRQERKRRTRRALLDAALDLLVDDSFSALSLRALTKRVGVVPTAFYRHFSTLDDLGLVLVEESFAILRPTTGTILTANQTPETTVADIVDMLITQLDVAPERLGFITRERHGGVVVLREAISRELSRMEHAVSMTLARVPGLEHWGSGDLDLLASLLLDLMVAAGAELGSEPGARAEIHHKLRTKARMVLVGAAGSHPSDA